MSHHPSLRIRVVPQKADSDCGVAVLSMLLDKSYEDVYVEVAKVDKGRARKGLFLSQMKKVAAAFGHKLVTKRNYDPEEDVGILSVTFADNDLAHVILLWNGVIVETDGTLWDYDTYFILNRAKADSFLALTESTSPRT